MFNLLGKTVVTAGGSTGIGKGTARAMVQAGARGVISGRHPDPIEEPATIRVAGASWIPGSSSAHPALITKYM
jgi:NAD(P)-dependent dehydrogenase (short-subunit alcohol dehydrogenase family)